MRSSRGAPRRVAVATILALAAGTSLRAQCPDGSPPPCRAAARRVSRPREEPPPDSVRARSLMVLPFRNLSNASAQAWLVEASTTMISNGLRADGEFTIAPDEAVYPALRRQGLVPGTIMDAARIRLVAEETGGWTAVLGEVLVLPTRTVLSARAVDVVSGQQRAYATVDVAPNEDISAAFDTLAQRLRWSLGHLGLGPPSAAAPSLAPLIGRP